MWQEIFQDWQDIPVEQKTAKINQKSYLPPQGKVDKKWWIVDAEDKSLGRLASKIAQRLRGKDKAIFTPFLDCGDNVIVINAAKVRVTGGKLDKKVYHRYSGYPGGLRETRLRDMLDRKPEFPVWKAVKGMLPKNKLGRKQLKNLKVYAGSEHPHASQKPEKWEI